MRCIPSRARRGRRKNASRGSKQTLTSNQDLRAKLTTRAEEDAATCKRNEASTTSQDPTSPVNSNEKHTLAAGVANKLLNEFMILKVFWDGLWALSFVLSQFHGHGTWLVCKVVLNP